MNSNGTSPGCPEVLVQVERDETYIARLLEAEIAFWAKVTSGR